MSEAKKTTTIRCPGCDKFVDEAFYPQHVDSGHTVHVIEIKGVDPMMTTGKPPTAMLDLPYIGRVRRDGFIAWTMLMLLLGILMGARII